MRLDELIKVIVETVTGLIQLLLVKVNVKIFGFNILVKIGISVHVDMTVVENNKVFEQNKKEANLPLDLLDPKLLIISTLGKQAKAEMITSVAISPVEKNYRMIIEVDNLVNPDGILDLKVKEIYHPNKKRVIQENDYNKVPSTSAVAVIKPSIGI